MILAWIGAHIGTIIVICIVAAVLGLAVLSLIRNKRKGKSSCSCGCGCGGCPMSGMCHEKETSDET